MLKAWTQGSYCFIKANTSDQTHLINFCFLLYLTTLLLICHQPNSPTLSAFSYSKTVFITTQEKVWNLIQGNIIWYSSYKQYLAFPISDLSPLMRDLSSPPLFQESVLCFLPLSAPTNVISPNASPPFHYVPLCSARFKSIRHKSSDQGACLRVLVRRRGASHKGITKSAQWASCLQ